MKNVYNNEIIIAYLLGTLSEKEADKFDELSFTDDNFADELSAAEKDLVDSYVRGELRGTTLEQFKNYYLASPIRRGKVQFAQVFQEFAGKNVAENTTANVEEKPKRSSTGYFSGIFSFQRPLLQWGFATAALVLLIFGGLLFRENSRLRFEMSQAQSNENEIAKRESELQQREIKLQNEIANQTATNSETEPEFAKIREEREKLQQELTKSKQQKQIIEQKQIEEQRAAAKKQTTTAPNRQITIATFTLAPSLRGNNLPTISLPSNTDSAKMRLELESDEFPTYRIALQNSLDGKILWQSGSTKSKKNGEGKILIADFPAKLLKPSIYILRVSGVSPNGAAENISSYSFRVVQ